MTFAAMAFMRPIITMIWFITMNYHNAVYAKSPLFCSYSHFRVEKTLQSRKKPLVTLKLPNMLQAEQCSIYTF